MTLKAHSSGLVVLTAALTIAACTPTEVQRFGNGSQNFGDVGEPKISVSGNAWDPEALWYLVAMCGTLETPCEVPPVTVPFLPGGVFSAIRGVEVKLFDPLNPMGVLPATGPTDEEGGWIVEGVPMRDDVPFFALTTAPASGPSPAPPAGGLPVAPPTTYQPTMDLKPIATRFNYCMGQPAALLGDTGILEAVAKHLTLTGTATTVADLSSPARFGGVVVWWMLQPSGAGVHVPAFGATMEASVGQVLNVNWAPPGALPPEVQSERGFFVDDTGGGMGVVVTLLPPKAGPPAPVQFTAIDPVSDAEQGRPWAFPPLGPITVGPGISFGELPAIAGGGPPPEWACLPAAH